MSHTDATPVATPASDQRALPAAIAACRLDYQPQVGLRDAAYGRTVGYEALLRCLGANPDPAPLLHAIEDQPEPARLSSHLALLARIAPMARRIQRTARVPVAVNVPACVLEDSGAADWLAAHAGALTIEILETEPVRDYPALGRAVAALRAHGSRVAIDDYGAGRWNALALARLPAIDAVKLDRELLRTANGRALLPSLVGAIHALGARAVVEGVESPRDHALACNSSADVGQGYWYGRPFGLPLQATLGNA